MAYRQEQGPGVSGPCAFADCPHPGSASWPATPEDAGRLARAAAGLGVPVSGERATLFVCPSHYTLLARMLGAAG
jgi:hypothetical protein